MTTVDSVVSAEQMLANAAKAVASGKTTKNMSAVQKLLAGREETDTVELSPVAKILAKQQKAAEAKAKSFEESDEFLQMKARELSRRLQMYSRIPGMEAVYAATEQEARELVSKIAERQKASADELAAKQKELEEARKKNESTLLTPEQLLARLNGEAEVNPEKQKAADALLKKLKVDTTA